jgi:cyclopropane-fatty-acyl-phospholipid synthase
MLTSPYCERAKIFDALFERYSGTPFCIRLWDGWQWASPTQDESRCTLIFNTPGALEALLIRPSELTLGEA